MGVDPKFWAGRRVLITGVTGFKGGWLSLWLRELGADVVGYSLPPPTRPSLFESARLGEVLRWREADVRDREALRRAVDEWQPEVVFHLAAQPLVRASYATPVETFDTNVMGTVNVLDVLRDLAALRAVVVVTTDKCYENREWCWPYRETDALGGHDPYSASKACAELAARAYFRSFFQSRNVGVATARAGNVIGGGDWARDRLLPDAISALVARESIPVRSPASVRPWQHVLEPVQGYLMLAERLARTPETFSDGWNFGPSPDAVRSVADVIESVCSLWGDGARWHPVNAASVHEATLLRLDASKAQSQIGWRPRLALSAALEWTVAWYTAFRDGADMRDVSLRQLRRYTELSS
jgi:CDP-glucose 4,6-dehydratase